MDKKQFLEIFFKKVDEQFKEVVIRLEKKDPNTADILKRSKYSVFYSNPLETLKEGLIYYLGFNPGGGPDIKYEDENVDYFEKKEKEHAFWSDFLHGEWENKRGKFKKGEAPHQKRVKRVLEQILELRGIKGPNIGKVFCTNLYFYRSKDIPALLKYDKYDCWPYHEAFFEKVKPEVIVCNGNNRKVSAFSEIEKKFSRVMDSRSEEKRIRKKYFLKWFYIKPDFSPLKRVLVLGFPHFSRFSPPFEELSEEMGKLINAT